MPTFALLLLVAYLLGSLSGSLLLGRMRGVDIRTQGSGNAGGTNALRTQGWRFALAVVAIDLGKGAVAAGLALWLAEPGLALSPRGQALACGLAAMAGHAWPLFFGFRGGKGAGTLVGALLVAWPLALALVLPVWLLVLVLSGYVGLATVLAAASLLPAAVLLPGPTPARLAFAVAATLFIAFTHRANLQRLRSGSEYRFERVRLLRRRTPTP